MVQHSARDAAGAAFLHPITSMPGPRYARALAVLISRTAIRSEEDGIDINIGIGDFLSEELEPLSGQRFDSYFRALGLDCFVFDQFSLHIMGDWIMSDGSTTYGPTWLRDSDSTLLSAAAQANPPPDAEDLYVLKIDHIDELLRTTSVKSIYLSSTNTLYVTLSNRFTLQTIHTDTSFLDEYDRGELWRILFTHAAVERDSIIVEDANWYVIGREMTWDAITQRLMPKLNAFGYTRLCAVTIKYTEELYEYQLLVGNQQQQMLVLFVDFNQNFWSIKPYQQSALYSQPSFALDQIACDPDALVFELLANDPEQLMIRLARQDGQLVWAISGLGGTTLCVDATRPFTGLRG